MTTSPAGLDRPAKPPLIRVDEALERLLVAVSPLEQPERVATPEAWGRVLAQDVVSTVDVPPADNSAMDGYAVRLADLAADPAATLPVRQRIAAGHLAAPLEPGTAARIFTGAQVPAGADAVVMQENCEAVPAAPSSSGRPSAPGVRILELPGVGEAIRRRGEDVRVGATVLAAGRRLDAAAVGLLATVGLAQVAVARRPRVALFSTGDELVMPGEPLPPGAIYNSNRYLLGALLRGVGCSVTDLGLVPDRLDATRAVLRRAAVGHDLILSSGGVSVGEEDHLRPALLAEGRLDLWSIAIKPGKPLAFGAVRHATLDAEPGQDAERGRPSHAGSETPASAGETPPSRAISGETFFLGLPGNPVSSFVTFVLFVRPVLLRMQGVTALAPAWMELRAEFDWPRPDRRREFLRGRRTATGGVELFPNQGSGVLTSVAWADGLVDIAPSQAVARGDSVRFLPLAELAP
ncbi:MAG TPA: molybdopterin molybdotransferase MoeA [Burkholderiaceae bacterium]|jgi:molybdopterin molybdotransferase|nr:molybdopterin molybdotransferase MoeA [Burkholderiaceae bacterium]